MPRKPGPKGKNRDSVCRRRFIKYYGSGMPGAEAVRKAGYPSKDPKRTAFFLLQDPDVQAAVEQEKKEWAATIQVECHQVLREYMRIAFSDVTEFYVDDDGKLRSTSLDEHATRAVASCKQTIRALAGGAKKTEIDIRMHSKTKALEVLARILNMVGPESSGESPGVLVVRGVDLDVALGLKPAPAAALQPPTPESADVANAANRP